MVYKYKLLEDRYTNIIFKFFKGVKKKHKVICLFVTGSYFTKKLSKRSDLDIFLITDKTSNLREKGIVIMDKIKISYFLNPYWKILELLNSEKTKFKRPTAEFVYFSHCLMGRKNGKTLKGIAKDVIDSLTPKLDTEESLYLCWKLYDKIDVFKRKNYNKLNKEYLKFDLFDFSINTFLSIKLSYKPHAKYVLLRIKELDKFFYNKVKKFLQDKSDNNLIDLSEHICKLLGFNQKDYFKRTKAQI